MIRKKIRKCQKIDIYGAFTQDQPTFVKGKDFFALNYGKEYRGGESRRIGISGDTESYEAWTPAKEFPQKIAFIPCGPHLVLTEADHVDILKQVSYDTNLKLDYIVSALSAEGIKFENKAEFEKRVDEELARYKAGH